MDYRRELDICKLMDTDRSYTERYGSRRSTTNEKFQKIHKENDRHTFENQCAAEAR